MDTTVWIVVAVALVVLVVVLALALARSRRARTTQLREQFGDEYDRRVEHAGSEKQARKDLSGVQERREQLDIRDLAPAARDRYLQRWQVVQGDFVDRPGPAVDQANDLVQDVMRERGYPVDDFGTRADMVAVDHPEVVQDYRAASDARSRHHDAGAEATTEDLRRAMVHYRALFERLVGGTTGADATGGATSGSHAPAHGTQDELDLRASEERATDQHGRPIG